MGNNFSRHVAQRGTDLIDIHQGLLYTVLEFVFTHSASPTGLADFITSVPALGLFSQSTRRDKACHILCLFALVSYTIPEDDFAAAFVDPQPSDWITKYMEATGKREPRGPMGSEFRLRPGNRRLLSHMQHESRQLYPPLSTGNALTSRAERRRRENSRFYDVSVAGAYHVMDGDAKLEAVDKALGLLASLVQQADLRTVFRKGIIPQSVRRFVDILPKDDSQRKEIFALSRLVGAFEAERARLLEIKLDRAAKAQSGRYLWPRWGSPRPRPARTGHAPLIPPSLSPKQTVSHDVSQPNMNVRKAIYGKALWKSGDLKVLHVIQETARARALLTESLSTTWSRPTSSDVECTNVGVVSAHTATAVGGSGDSQVTEEANGTLRAAFALNRDGNVDEGNDGIDTTVEAFWETPAMEQHVAASDHLGLADHSILYTESRSTEIEDAQQLPDEEVHELCMNHALKDPDDLYSSDHAIPATAPQLEDTPSGPPLSEELDFMKLLYLPVVHEIDPGDDQDARLHWIMDDIEDGK
ncbi:hypothetical protein MMC18_008342 [Xylographa bjoerkii]|nr:hypothetical protein [Xylographa bjoerkii]